ncbi:hypothetical protein CC85DRAFT_289452 [Cutaneotrichosporon oleaginosum]|uniref:DUF323 domain-containing protein n=1 Tax=Cutaneotrichosporon oleaginosum TaxID=879819 RepID=A0A0J1AT63_9TREE|nr:uncharacterized protein CC85DRAFT_289452 [Cutaneotrichosporon oleaginosum]KLT38504.1 hypothetical protein CC85DRAFT_289452 [Cutaneotrichosporon oleaginosum]TXT12304.1 hypothetical protein COLE_02714 [Cutaneotrichosporon oleaginosum]
MGLQAFRANARALRRAGTSVSNLAHQTRLGDQCSATRHPSVPKLPADLSLYDGITAHAKEYYLFEDELSLLKEHGSEIAAAMGFPRRRRRDFPPPKEWKPARWGDADVGRWNNGVNGEEGLAAGVERGWDVVELGAGALRKTAHLLTALADTLPPTDAAPITYHALDLSFPELDRVLGQMEEGYGAALEGRVACVGLHGDYNAGIKVVRSGTLADLTRSSEEATPSTPSDDAASAPGSPLSANLVTPAMEATDLPSIAGHDDLSIADEVDLKDTRAPAVETPAPTSDRPLHFMFLGSSLGNFAREEAAPFLKSLPLRQGDTLLLGLDGRPPNDPEGKKKVEIAYNDPSGYTKAFEEHGWDVARKELGLEPDDGIEFVGRYNEALGRHEAYYRSKRKQTIPLSNESVELEEGELLHIEWSFKYSLAEALTMFEEADLRVVDSWKAPNSEYRLWLLERPAVRFAASPDESRVARSLPTLREWDELWALWDHITLGMIPKEMLHQKPIDLRHICLFYLGHIPTFLDIYMTRMTRVTDGKPTHPEYFKDIFERGIDPDVDDPTQVHAHSEVPQREEDWPSLDQITRFRDAVRQRLRKIYADTHDGRQLSRFEARSLFMAYEHEAMHAETLLYMLLQSPLTRAPTKTPEWETLAAHWAVEAEAAAAHGWAGILDVPATRVVLGHNDSEGDDAGHAEHEFGWDIEHPATAVEVAPFRASALPVTNGEYLEWVRAIGAMPALDERSAPASWVRVDGEWAVKTLFGAVPMHIAASWPLMASRDELAAYAASRGGRLPTEAELRALWAHPHGPRPAGLTANIGFRAWHPTPPRPAVRDTAGGVLHGHNGGVWEWTDTPLAGLPGYEASKLYPGYSADFFDGKHYVVLGGSFATVPQIARRASFRNWYQGNYRYAWVGGRVVYDA